jgi:hypothetical protein
MKNRETTEKTKKNVEHLTGPGPYVKDAGTL